MKYENVDGSTEYAVNGGLMAMYHMAKPVDGDAYRINGWLHPAEKAKVGDTLYGVNLHGTNHTMEIESIEYTDHPGVFGKYELKQAQDSDKKLRSHLVDLEPNHPNKQGSRYVALCRVIKSKRKPTTTE